MRSPRKARVRGGPRSRLGFRTTICPSFSIFGDSGAFVAAACIERLSHGGMAVTKDANGVESVRRIASRARCMFPSASVVSSREHPEGELYTSQALQPIFFLAFKALISQALRPRTPLPFPLRDCAIRALPPVRFFSSPSLFGAQLCLLRPTKAPQSADRSPSSTSRIC